MKWLPLKCRERMFKKKSESLKLSTMLHHLPLSLWASAWRRNTELCCYKGFPLHNLSFRMPLGSAHTTRLHIWVYQRKRTSWTQASQTAISWRKNQTRQHLQHCHGTREWPVQDTQRGLTHDWTSQGVQTMPERTPRKIIGIMHYFVIIYYYYRYLLCASQRNIIYGTIARSFISSKFKHAGHRLRSL